MRADGRYLKRIDYFFKIIPHIMPQRCDAQVFTPQRIRADRLMDYVRAQRETGRELNYMSVLIAAYVRTVAEHPELNRFVISRKIYARKYLSVSFAVLRENEDGVEETTSKVYFEPADTLTVVSDKINRTIDENRKPGVVNATDKLAATLMSVPLLPTALVGFLKLLDRVGLLPRAILDASPFHTSLFFTNMASIRSGYLFHHLYNFGTTSAFIALGSPEKVLDEKGVSHIVLPLGVTTDERICPGVKYATAFRTLRYYLLHPEALEQPPKEVKADPAL